MARVKKTEREEVVVDDLAGTVEGLARDHFLRDVAEAEERTGIKNNYYWPDPLTRTPIVEQSAVGSQQSAEEEETAEA